MLDYAALLEFWLSFGAPANIYEVDSSVEPLDDIVELAQLAGMSGADPSAWNEFGPLLEIEQEPYLCTVFRPSRAVRLVDTGRWQVDDGTAHLDLTDSEATFAAVQEAGFLRLLDEDQFALSRVTRLNVATAERGQPAGDERVIDVGVVLTRQRDGLSFLGQGGNVVMYLGPDLRPTGFERTARRIAGVREAVSGWRGLDEVLAELDAYWGPWFGGTYTIEDVQLGYLELGRLEEQEIIQPVYAIDLNLAGGGGSDDAVPESEFLVQHLTPAAQNGFGPLMPSLEPAEEATRQE
ncbi:hypothetical protein OHT76_43560 [Streptomyces sp. NBC_00287]|uniref:hypothetical protein n=1 Tax=Streptomyces sp. NBC_00287 TaxID=2975702 RepID=UPI002E2864D7|nr:hypothetical protein [Streptomyces sp. NBC_00287]